MKRVIFKNIVKLKNLHVLPRVVTIKFNEDYNHGRNNFKAWLKKSQPPELHFKPTSAKNCWLVPMLWKPKVIPENVDSPEQSPDYKEAARPNMAYPCATS